MKRLLVFIVVIMLVGATSMVGAASLPEFPPKASMDTSSMPEPIKILAGSDWEGSWLTWGLASPLYTNLRLVGYEKESGEITVLHATPARRFKWGVTEFK